MGDELFTDTLSREESIAVWLDGGLTYEEELEMMDTIVESPELMGVVESLEDIEEGYEEMIECGIELPSELMFDFRLPEMDEVSVFEDEIEYSEFAGMASDEPYSPDIAVQGGEYEDEEVDEASEQPESNDSETSQDSFDEWSDLSL